MTKDAKVQIVVALIGVLGGTGAGYFSGLAAIGERVRAVEVRQEEQYRAIVDRVDRVAVSTREGQNDVRSDLNGIRGEIMQILKELR